MLRQNGQSPGNFRGCPWFQQSGSKYQEMKEHRDLFLFYIYSKGLSQPQKRGSLRLGDLGVFLYVYGQKLSWDEVTAETGALTAGAIKVLVHTSAVNQVLSPRCGNFPLIESHVAGWKT